jgi:hypothetical protein
MTGLPNCQDCPMAVPCAMCAARPGAPAGEPTEEEDLDTGRMSEIYKQFDEAVADLRSIAFDNGYDTAAGTAGGPDLVHVREALTSHRTQSLWDVE